MTTVLVALSGGLDSAATILMLREQGYSVSAVYLDMHGNRSQTVAVARLAKRVNVKLEICDVQRKFSATVKHYFFSELNKGHTPAPCSFCNPHLKWKELLQVADQCGVDLIATGHYVNQTEINGRRFLTKGIDPTKDQSYYLWDIDQQMLARTLFPLGGFTKSQVRNYLSERGFDDVACTKESMSLCFLPQGVGYADYVRQNVGLTPGDVVDAVGEIVGRHDGIQLYTVGQRRGFSAFDPSRMYSVQSIDREYNRLIVSDSQHDLYTSRLRLRDWRTADENLLLSSKDLNVLVRGFGRNPQGYCSVIETDGQLEVTLDDAAWAVAPGQPAVFYQGDVLVGGGYVI